MYQKGASLAETEKAEYVLGGKGHTPKKKSSSVIESKDKAGTPVETIPKFGRLPGHYAYSDNVEVHHTSLGEGEHDDNGETWIAKLGDAIHILDGKGYSPENKS